MCEEEVLLCTQKIMMVLIDMHNKGMITTEAFYSHTFLKARYLEECSALSKYPAYSNDLINILSCYRNILEENPVFCRTQV